MKKKITLLILFGAFYMFGMITYHNNWFPKPQMSRIKSYFVPPKLPTHINKLLTQYTVGLPVFSDRDYHDTIGDSRLESSYVLQVPRHLDTSIQIEVHRPVKIFRLLSGSKSNIDFSEWDPTDIKVHVKGNTCTHSTVVSKIFNPGILTLESGGPVASSPIIVKELSDILPDLPITILDNIFIIDKTK